MAVELGYSFKNLKRIIIVLYPVELLDGYNIKAR